MKNKKFKSVILGASVILVVISGGYFGYQYWLQGTPDYSFQQIHKAFTSHDTAALDEYYDTDSIFNNIWPRILRKYENFESTYSQQSALAQVLNIGVFKNQESAMKNAFKQGAYDAVLGKLSSGQSTEIKQGSFASILSQPDIHFVVKDSGVATADFVYKDYASNNSQNYPVYQIKIIMTKQSDRHWKVTDLQGFEDVATDSSIGDPIRLSDLQTTGNLINQYIDSKQKPFLDNNNWRTTLTAYLSQKGKYTVIPDDPLSSYGNKYDFAITDSDSIQKYSWVLRAKLSTADNGVFQNPLYKNSSYRDTIKVMSKGSNNVLGLDCNAPAFCYNSWGNMSDVSQLLKNI